MKVRNANAVARVVKLSSVVALSAVLVACGGGGTSADDGLGNGDLGDVDFEGLDGDLDGGLEGLDGDGFGEDLISDGLTDTFGLEVDVDLLSNPISDSQGRLCDQLDGFDPSSFNEDWNDNCHLVFSATTSPNLQGTYVEGVQRILFCQGHAGTLSLDVFADGDYGMVTRDAMRDFQIAQGLISDGFVGGDTWNRLREQLAPVDAESTSQRDAFRIVVDNDIDLTDPRFDFCFEPNFFALFATTDRGGDIYARWEISEEPGVGLFEAEPVIFELDL